MALTPNSRLEMFLQAVLSGDTSQLPKPITREETYLYAIALKGSGGGGGGGTTDYNNLNNKPRINNNILAGNKTSVQLGLQSILTFDNTPTSGSNNPVRSNGIRSALDLKVDKITLNGDELVPVNGNIVMEVIDNTVNNLTNYYLKTELYSKTEIDALVGQLTHIEFEIVESLPTSDISTTTVYLVLVSGTTDNYMQYMYINNDWAELGSTQVDLSNYYNKTQVDALLALKQDLLTFDATPTQSSNNPVKSGGIFSALAEKQDKLTFDNVPTENSTNPVKSGGVFSALEGKEDTLTFDTAPTEDSTNPVESGGVYTALEGKQDTLTFDNAPTQNSSNPVKSGGVYTAIKDATANMENAWTGTYTAWQAVANKIPYDGCTINITGD